MSLNCSHGCPVCDSSQLISISILYTCQDSPCTASTSQSARYATLGYSVSVQDPMLHQFRKAHLRLHLQEHQRHFTLRGEVGLPSSLGHHALIHKLQALRHLAQREDLLHPSQFILFKRSTELFVKIVLREREIWCNLSKISYLHHCIFDNRFPDFCFPTAIGGIFHSDIKDTKYLTTYQSICYKVFNNSRLPLT